MNINEYIPSNGVEVLFRLVTTTIETVNVDQGRLLKYRLNQKYQVIVSDDGYQNRGLIFTGKLHHCQLILLKYPFSFLNIAAITKTVTLNIRNQTIVTVTELALNASLYEVMEQAANERKLMLVISTLKSQQLFKNMLTLFFLKT